MDMSEEAVSIITPNILSLESFYTNLMKQELIKVASEFKDNPDEAKATDDVINSIYAVITIDGTSISLSYECNNEVWLDIIDQGMEPTDVTGGRIKLPQGGERESKAAVTGGKYEAAKETATLAKENVMKMAESFFKTDLEDLMKDDLVITMLKGHIVEEVKKVLGGNAS